MLRYVIINNERSPDQPFGNQCRPHTITIRYFKFSRYLQITLYALSKKDFKKLFLKGVTPDNHNDL